MEDYVQHILLIDPIEDDYFFIRDLLAQWSESKFELSWVTTYEAALAAISGCQYALYLIEYDLGTHTGLELLVEAGQLGYQAPLILLTKTNDRTIDLAAMRAGAADCLAKEQLEASHLERSIRYAIQRQQVSTERDRLLKAEREQRELAEALREVSTVLNSTLAFDTILDRLLEQIARVVPYDSGNVMIVEEEEIYIFRMRDYEQFGPNAVQAIQSISFNIADTKNLHHIVETRQPLVISNTETYGHWVTHENMEHIRSWIGAPIVVQGEVVAIFSLDKIEPDFYQPEHADLLKLFANLVAPALENAWSFEAEARRRHEAETLREATVALTSALDLDQVLENILLQLAQVVPYDSTCLFLKEEDKVRVMAGRGLPNPTQVIGQRYPLDGEILFGEMQHTQQPIYIADAQADPRFLSWGEATYVRGWLGVPLITRGEVIGYLTLDSHQYGAYGDVEATAAQAFANQAATAIENARLFQAAQQARQLSDTLWEIGASMTATLNLDEVLNRILDGLGQVVPYSSASVWLLEDDTHSIRAGRGFLNDAELWSLSFNLDDNTLAAEVLKDKKPLYIPDVHQESRWVKAEGDEHIRAWLGVPLLMRNKAVGFFNIDHNQPGYYTKEHVALATAFAQQAAVAIENARLFETAERRVAELDAVREASLSLTSSLELQTVLETILEHTLKLMTGAHNTNIFLYRADKLTFGAALSTDGRSDQPFAEPRSDGLTYTVARQGKLVVVPDMQNHPLFENVPPDWIGSIIGLPLKIGQRIVGVMTLANKRARAWSEAELHILHLLADQAAVAIENARLFEAERAAREQAEKLKEETRKTLAQFTRLYELSTEIVSALSLEAAANLVMEKVVQATEAHSAILNLLDQEGNLELAIGPSESPPRASGTTTTIFKTGQPLIVSDVTAEPGLMNPELLEKGIKASIGLPLKAGRQIIGALFVRFDRPRQFSQQELETLFIFANQAAIAIQNARLYERVQQHAIELQEKVAERTSELRVMYELAQALGQATGLGDIIRLILLHLYQATPYDLAACLLTTGPACRLVIQSQYRFSASLETDIKEITFTIMTRLGNEDCWASQLNIHRIQPKRDKSNQPLLESLGSLLQVPITINAVPVGVLLIGTQQIGKFGPEQAYLLRTVADQAAESIQRLQSLLAAEHHRLENLVAQLPDGVILLDSDRRIVLANPMGQEFLAATSETTVGHTLTFLDEQPIGKVLTSGSAGTPFEVTTSGLAGNLFEVTAKSVAVGLQAGGSLLVIRDVTVERATQRRIKQQEQLAAVGQLAAGIAHDFNNILTSIIGFAELMQLEPELPDSAKPDLERIANQGHRAARLVRQILDFSRQSITEKRSLDLVPVVKELIKLLERTIPENIQITLHIEPPDKGYTIMADLSQMQQALTNLAVNARDAMPSGGKMQFRLSRFSLEPGVQPPQPEMSSGDWIVLSISDTGVGISSKDHPHIFEPFFTTKETGQGTGLGLAQVYGIITDHGGYINVDSRAGEGTIFRLYLSVRPTGTGPLPLPAPSAIPQGHGETILVVEDDAAVLDTTKAMLMRLRYQVLTATNGQNALELYEQYQAEIGLVLTDITMPDMDGTALSQILHKKNPNLKIIALTGYPLETSREASVWQAQGISDWLQKPVTLEQLGQTVKRLLRLEGQE